MKVVQGDQVVPRPTVQYRGGGVMARILLEGEPGTPGNFQLSLGVTGKNFISPRHRHNFEQYRLILDGHYEFGRDGVMTNGMAGYFPEGVFYGPQSSDDDTQAIVLQFGGTSGSGYLSVDEVGGGMDELKEIGEFHGGVFRRREGVPGRRNQDAFEAIWEHVNGRAVTYPVSSQAAPTLFDPATLEWTPVQGQPGVSEKRLGRFEENRTGVRMLRLEEGARLNAPGRGLYLALSGHGTVAGEPLRRLTAIDVEAGEAAAIAASEPVVLLHCELPVLPLNA